MTLLRFVRLHQGWTLRTAGEHIGVAWPTLGLIETKRYIPTDAMLQRLADAYGITPPASLLKEVTLQDLHLVNTPARDLEHP